MAGVSPLKLADETYDQYYQRVIDIVCAEMANGKSLRRSCRENPQLPDASTIMAWVRKNPELAKQYACAREQMTDVRFEDLEIKAAEIVQKYTGLGWEPKDAINMAKLECENEKWELSKLAPKKYGDKMTQEITGPDGQPLSLTPPPFINIVYPQRQSQKISQELAELAELPEEK